MAKLRAVECREFIQAVVEKAEQMHVPVAIAIVNAEGLIIQQWFKERNPQMLMNASVFSGGKAVVSGGCAPVFKGDELVGCYGISGGTSDQDEIMGRYAREKVGWAHKPVPDDMTPDVKEHVNQLYDSVGLGERKL